MSEFIEWLNNEANNLENSKAELLSHQFKICSKKAIELLEKEKNLIKVAFVEGEQNKRRKYKDSEEFFKLSFKQQ
jgi:hypothetical protein